MDVMAEAPEELLNEVWLNAVGSGAGEPRGPKALLCWLREVAWHRVIDRLRKRRLDPLPDRSSQWLQGGLVSLGTSPSRAAFRRERDRLIGECVARLEPAYRQVIDLHYRHGLRAKEVAEQIGVSEELVRKRLQRARDQLKQQLDRSEIER